MFHHPERNPQLVSTNGPLSILTSSSRSTNLLSCSVCYRPGMTQGLPPDDRFYFHNVPCRSPGVWCAIVWTLVCQTSWRELGLRQLLCHCGELQTLLHGFVFISLGRWRQPGLEFHFWLFGKLPEHFPRQLPCSTSPSAVLSPSVSAFPPTLLLSCLFYCSHLGGWTVVSHCSFDLYFLNV